MREALAALAGAVIGGLASILGTLFSGRAAIRAQRLRQEVEQHAAFVQLVRSQAAEVFRVMLAVQFHIDGVCWLAKYAPHRVDENLVDRYEAEMQVLLPQVGGAMAVLAGLDLGTHKVLQPWTDELDRLDGDVARLLYAPITDQTIPRLAELHEQSAGFYKRLPAELGSVLESVGSPPRPPAAPSPSGP
jgi:hypothetical protein